jgi:uncharacterized lipoprotein YmbA
MKTRTLIAALTLMTACSTTRSPDSVAQDVARYTLKVQDRTDEAAKTCHRATTAAAIASANISEPLKRGETVPPERHAELEAADKAMQEACAQFE